MFYDRFNDYSLSQMVTQSTSTRYIFPPNNTDGISVLEDGSLSYCWINVS